MWIFWLLFGLLSTGGAEGNEEDDFLSFFPFHFLLSFHQFISIFIPFLSHQKISQHLLHSSLFFTPFSLSSFSFFLYFPLKVTVSLYLAINLWWLSSIFFFFRKRVKENNKERERERWRKKFVPTLRVLNILLTCSFCGHEFIFVQQVSSNISSLFFSSLTLFFFSLSRLHLF